MALKRLEERLDAQGRKDAQSGTDDTPLHRIPPRSAVWNAVKTRVNTKGSKGQRIKGSSPPQARVFNPERNELNNRNVDCWVPKDSSVTTIQSRTQAL